MNKNSKIFVAGSSGMVGSSIYNKLIREKYKNILTPSSKKLNLLNQKKVELFFKKNKPEYVFMCAGKVGGIFANITYPADFIYKNTQMILNVIHYSYIYKVKKLLFFGSSCIYPKNLKNKITEDQILTAPMEDTNLSYAIAKIVGLQMCNAYNSQFNTKFISLMPSNLYGPNDKYDLKNSHVIPSLIMKFHNAKIKNLKEVIVFGSGKARREFLYVEDLADASLFLMKKFNKNININVGSGYDISIAELSMLIKKIIKFKGKIIFDKSKPEGQLKKLMDVTKINKLGWKFKTDLNSGILQAYNSYKNLYF